MPRFLVRILSVFLLLVLSLVLSDGAPPAAAEDTGSVSGTVYFDLNMNEQRDPGELPAPGRTVNLTTGEDESRVVESVETGRDGRYSFDDLTPGVGYTLALVPDDSDLCWEGEYALMGEDTVTDADLWVIEKGSGAVSGTVFSDVDEDGVRDSGEAGLAGWSLELYPAAIWCPIPATTDGQGRYNFAGLPNGVYDMYQQWPIAPDQTGFWEQTAPLEPWGEFSPVAGLRVPAHFDLNEEEKLHGVDVGVRLVEGGGSISGVFFRDLDMDQTRDDDEPPADCVMGYFFRLARKLPSGVRVYLEAVYPTCQDGHFEVAGLAAGNYNAGMAAWCDLGQTLPNEWVTLAEGQRVDGVNMAVCPGAFEPTPTPGPPLLPTQGPPPPTPVILIAVPATGTGGVPSDSGLASLAAVLAVAGTLIVSATAIVYTQRHRVRRGRRRSSE